MPRASLFFFSVTRPPPRPTLFPYTTLFRSDPVDRRVVGRQPDALEAAANDRAVGHAVEADVVEDLVPREVLLDRKSTRLNSSHSSISYAVFCLKKKTTTRPGPRARAVYRTG